MRPPPYILIKESCFTCSVSLTCTKLTFKTSSDIYLSTCLLFQPLRFSKWIWRILINGLSKRLTDWVFPLVPRGKNSPSRRCSRNRNLYRVKLIPWQIGYTKSATDHSPPPGADEILNARCSTFARSMYIFMTCAQHRYCFFLRHSLAKTKTNENALLPVWILHTVKTG